MTQTTTPTTTLTSTATTTETSTQTTTVTSTPTTSETSTVSTTITTTPTNTLTTPTTTFTTTQTTTQNSNFYFTSGDSGPTPTISVELEGDCEETDEFLKLIANKVAHKYKSGGIGVASVEATCRSISRRRQFSGVVVRVSFVSWEDLDNALDFDLSSVDQSGETFVVDEVRVIGFTEIPEDGSPPQPADVVILQYVDTSNLRTRQPFSTADTIGSTCGYPANVSIIHNDIIIRVYSNLQLGSSFDIPSTPSHDGKVVIRFNPILPEGANAEICPGVVSVLDTSCQSDLLRGDQFGPSLVVGFRQAGINVGYCPQLLQSAACAATRSELAPCDFCENSGEVLRSLTIEYMLPSLSSSDASDYTGNVDITISVGHWQVPYTFEDVSPGEAILFDPQRFISQIYVQVSIHSDRCSPSRCLLDQALIDVTCDSQIAIGDRLAGNVYIKAYSLVSDGIPNLESSHCQCESVTSAYLCGPGYGATPETLSFVYKGSNCDPNNDPTCNGQIGALTSHMSVEGTPPTALNDTTISVYHDLELGNRLILEISSSNIEIPFALTTLGDRLIFVIKENGITLSRIVIDTSCGSPLIVGNSYGSLKLVSAKKSDLVDEASSTTTVQSNPFVGSNNLEASAESSNDFATPFFATLGLLVVSIGVFIGYRRRTQNSSVRKGPAAGSISDPANNRTSALTTTEDSIGTSSTIFDGDTGSHFSEHTNALSAKRSARIKHTDVLGKTESQGDQLHWDDWGSPSMSPLPEKHKPRRSTLLSPGAMNMLEKFPDINARPAWNMSETAVMEDIEINAPARRAPLPPAHASFSMPPQSSAPPAKPPPILADNISNDAPPPKPPPVPVSSSSDGAPPPNAAATYTLGKGGSVKNRVAQYSLTQDNNPPITRRASHGPAFEYTKSNARHAASDNLTELEFQDDGEYPTSLTPQNKYEDTMVTRLGITASTHSAMFDPAN